MIGSVSWFLPIIIVTPLAWMYWIYIHRNRPIPLGALTLERIREILSQTDLKTNGADTFFNSELGCEYLLAPDGSQKLSFRATNFWGKLTAEFSPDGKLLQWNDGGTTYPRDSDALRPICRHEVYLWESCLIKIQNARRINEFGGHEGAHAT